MAYGWMRSRLRGKNTLLSSISLCLTASLLAPSAAQSNPEFKITYGGDKYVGVFLGYDDESPIYMREVKAVDLNRDGFDDLVFSTNAKANSQLTFLPFKIFVSNGSNLVDRTSAVLPSKPEVQLTRDIHVADMNGDGWPDISLSNHGSEAFKSWTSFPGEQNRLFLSRGKLKYDDVSSTNLPQQTDFSHGSAIGDADGDGDIDIWVTNLGEDDLNPSALLLNDGTGKFEKAATWDNPGNRLPAEASSLPGPYWSHMLDMDGDGDLDLFLNEPADPRDDSKIRYLRNDGAGRFAFSGKRLPRFPNHPDSVVQDSFSVDIDRDGDEDLLLFDNGGEGPTIIQVLINRGGGWFVHESRRIPRLPNVYGHPIFTVVDLDGDGDHDIFVKNFNQDFSGEVAFALLNDGTGHFTRVPQSQLPKVRPAYAALDVNGDGLTDFLSDQTWQDDWNSDRKKQFKVTFARLDVPVTRTGWATDDKIAGGSRNDTLYGLAGDDILIGNGGNDTLFGGPGDDLLRGGPGRDRLVGGPGADSYQFKEADDLRNCPACDLIVGFQRGLDKIDLAAIDANYRVAGNQAFRFIGSARFSGRAGELRSVISGETTIVQGDRTGRGKADFMIKLNRPVTLRAADFIR